MQEMRDRMERVQEPEEKRLLYMPQMSDRGRKCVHKRRTCSRLRRWAKTLPVIMSLLVTAATYLNLAVMAYESRGYFAVGGELMISLVMGFFSYQYLKERR